MTEVKREPHHVVIDGKDCVAFDDDHSLSDIARWIAQNKSEAEHMLIILQMMTRESMN